jgi:Tol biopolymer transport system component
MQPSGSRASSRGRFRAAGTRLAVLVGLAIVGTLSGGCLNIPVGWITFHTGRDGNAEIYKMLSDGSQVTRLTNNTTPDFGPEWSPDGQCIAYMVGQGPNLAIWKMQGDGSQPTQVTPGTQQMMGISWAPYASKIAYDSVPLGK